MPGIDGAFFGIVRTPIVQGGEDVILSNGGHTAQTVYSTMLLQICRDYYSLPDPRTLRSHEIRFFYEGLREELKRAYKKNGK